MIARQLFVLLVLSVASPILAVAADKTPAGPAADKAGEKSAPAAPPAKLPDLAITKFAMSTEKPDRNKTVLLIRVENIGTAPSTRTGVIVDCRLPDKENRHCHGSMPPPRFHLEPLAIGQGRDFKLPLKRFLQIVGNQERHELRARVDTGVRIQDSNRFNNFKKFEIIY